MYVSFSLFRPIDMDFVEIRQRQSVYSADQTAQKFPSLELRLLCGSMYLNHSGRLHFLLGFEPLRSLESLQCFLSCMLFSYIADIEH